MLEIRINGQNADLQADTSIQLEKFNPMLDFDTVQGNRVYDFSLPNSPYNRAILGHVHNPQVAFRNRKFYCEKYFNSKMLESGYVKIAETSNEAFNLFFVENLGEIFGDYQTTPLNQIKEFGNEDVLPNMTGEGTKFVFPAIANDAFYGDNPKPEYNGIVNEYTDGEYNTVARVPMFFLTWVLQKYGEITGWTFTGPFMDDVATSKLILFNLYALDGSDTCYYNNHLPAMTAGGMLIELRKLFNLYLSFDIRKRVCKIEFVEDLLAGDTVHDWTEIASPRHRKVPDLNNRLEISYSIDSNDALLKPIPAEMDKYITPETAINDGGTLLQINSAFSTLLEDETSPKCQQAGLSIEVKENRSESTPKLLFSTGLRTASSRFTGRSLLFTGDDNLIEKSWKRFEKFKENTFFVEKTLTLTPVHLAKFKFPEKVHIQGVNY